jgi:exodeoxyribonuclease VII small subunit
MMAQKAVDYQSMSTELEVILAELQQGELDVDEAMKKYERGLELVAALESYLKDAETKVIKLKNQFGKEETSDA